MLYSVKKRYTKIEHDIDYDDDDDDDDDDGDDDDDDVHNDDNDHDMYAHEDKPAHQKLITFPSLIGEPLWQPTKKKGKHLSSCYAHPGRSTGCGPKELHPASDQATFPTHTCAFLVNVESQSERKSQSFPKHDVLEMNNHLPKLHALLHATFLCEKEGKK
jgi:hypothetical protein